MFQKIKDNLKGMVATLVALVAGGLTLTAHGQVVPLWTASDTEAVVAPAASSFKETFIMVLKVIAPYAIAVSLVVGLVWFFVRLARSH